MRVIRRAICAVRGHDPTLMWFGEGGGTCGRITGRLGCRRCRVPLVWGIHGRVRPTSSPCVVGQPDTTAE